MGTYCMWIMARKKIHEGHCMEVKKGHNDFNLFITIYNNLWADSTHRILFVEI